MRLRLLILIFIFGREEKKDRGCGKLSVSYFQNGTYYYLGVCKNIVTYMINFHIASYITTYKNEKAIKPLISLTFCSQNMSKISKSATFFSMKRNEDLFYENQTPCRKQSTTSCPLRWAPSPPASRLAGPQKLPHVSAAVALDDDLVLLFLAEFVIFFWTVITFSRAGFLPELKMMTNRPFLTTCYDSSLD